MVIWLFSFHTRKGDRRNDSEEKQ